MSRAWKWLCFHLMRLAFVVRDFFEQPGSILADVGLQRGSTVLDYGCGAGSFTTAAARLVGPAGTVHAADANPAAIRHVQRIAAKKALANVEAVRTDRATGLDDGSVDAVLLYDTFHALREPGGVLAELHRVLKPTGVLSFSDHHMKHEDILAGLTAGGRFKLLRRKERVYTFAKASPA